MNEAEPAADLAPSSPAALSARAAGENFPVALRVLPRRYRRHLMAVYRFARLVDDIGDEPSARLLAVAGDNAGEQGGPHGPGGADGREDGRPHEHVGAGADHGGPHGQAGAGEHGRPHGLAAACAERGRSQRDAEPADRLRALDLVEEDLDRAFRGGATPRLPVIGDLGRTAMECAIPAQPFRMLIDANRQDQRVRRYATFDELLGYCRLSANPVGKAVLHIFGVATPERERLSDLICTALQLAEHWQDVAEDFARDRIYLPQEDMAAFGCSERDLARATGHAHGPPDARRTVPPRLRMLLQFETERARRMLAEGAALTGTLRGWARLAVAGYVAGGRDTLLAIETAGSPRRVAALDGRAWAAAARDFAGAGGVRRARPAQAAGAGKPGSPSDGVPAAPSGFDVFGAAPRPSRARTAAGLARLYVAGR